MTPVQTVGPDRNNDEGPHAVVTDDRPPDSAPPVDLAWLEQLAVAALDALGVTGPVELALTLVEPEQIAALNAEFLSAEGPTDVLSFPMDVADEAAPGAEVGPRLLGDVVICPEVAATNAPDHTGDLDDELALLCVHGILHLLGHDHAEPEEAHIMRAAEADVLTSVHRPVAVGTEIPS